MNRFNNHSNQVLEYKFLEILKLKDSGLHDRLALEAAIETDFKDFSVGADYFAPVRVLQKYVYQVPMHLLVQSYRADHILLFRNFKELP